MSGLPPTADIRQHPVHVRLGLKSDTFCGSGTTLLAAERVGRQARAIEIDPRYVDVAIRRWQAFTGRDAVHIDTGLTFEEVTSDRRDPVLARSNRRAWR
jgi:tRNA/tmRNA/rRNA uracil-C5-methylase (TrmA/RlmC/RlmD family)